MKYPANILFRIILAPGLMFCALQATAATDTNNLAQKNLQLKSQAYQLEQQVEQAHQNFVNALNSVFQGVAKNLASTVTTLETTVNDLDKKLDVISAKVGDVNTGVTNFSKITTRNLLKLFEQELSSGGATTYKTSGGGLSYSDFSGIGTTLKGQFAIAASTWATGLSGPFTGSSAPAEPLDLVVAEPYRIEDALKSLIKITEGVIASETAFNDSINKIHDLKL